MGEVKLRLSILPRRGGEGEKTRADGAGIGEAEAGIKARAAGGGIDRREDKPALLVADQG